MEVDCPHCGGKVIIEQINCGIFRHGVYKNGAQVNPHMSKEECDRIKSDIYGCGKPFKIEQNKAVICDYI